MKVFNLGFLRSKFLECKIATIDEKIIKLQQLSLFFQLKFDEEMTNKINNKIDYLFKKKVELLTVFQ
jgi:hypothetical protein